MDIDINKVEDSTVDGVDMYDYPDFCDAYADHAVWKDTGKELTDEELDALCDKYPDEIHALAHESIQ